MGGWKQSQRCLSHTIRSFRGRGNLFLNAVWLQNCSPVPAPHLAVVAKDIVKGNEANCISQGSVLILSPLLVFCIRRTWLCQQHSIKDKASKICKSFRYTLLFTCPTCAYGQCITISRGVLRCPAAGSATRVGSAKCLVVRDGLNIIPWATFSTPEDCSNTAGNGYCCMWGFFF